VTFMLENLDDVLQLSMRVENVARDVGCRCRCRNGWNVMRCSPRWFDDVCGDFRRNFD